MKGSPQGRFFTGALVIAALLVTGCVQPAAQPAAPAAATAAQGAATPAPPIAPPSPTQEPTQAPRPTSPSSPSPALATPTVTSPGIPTEAYLTLLKVGNSLYQSGEYVMASTLYSEMLSRGPDPDVYALRADMHNRMGDFDAAIADYLAALALGTADDKVLNNLCWDLGITGQAEKALPYCEQAIEAEPSSSYRDSRGVVYAQLRMVPEAIADFQAVVDDLKNATDTSLKAIATERQAWITALEQGANPITPEVLAQLRSDDIAVAATATPVPGAAVVPLAAVREAASKAGFTFDEPNVAGGEETLTGVREKDACKAVLKLVGPETGLSAASLQASGCSDDEQSGLAYWFMTALLPGEREQAKAIAYLILDVYYVIEGQRETSGEQEIGNVILATSRLEGPAPGLEVTARFKRILQVYQPAATRIPDPDANVEFEFTELVTAEEVIAANVTADELADFILDVEEVVREVARGTQDECMLRIRVTLDPQDAPQIEIATQGAADDAWLQRLHDELDAMPTLHTKTDRVVFQVYFTVKADE